MTDRECASATLPADARDVDVEAASLTSASDDELRWTVHPAIRDPARSLVVAAVVLVAGLLVWRLTASPVLGLLGTTLLAASLRAWFLPRTYVLNERGASETGPLCSDRRLAWDEVRRVTSVRTGLHLSPRHSDSRMLPDRGLFLRRPPDRRQVEDFVAMHRVAS